MLSVKDIPDEMMAHIREAFERDPQVVTLCTQRDLLLRQGKLQAALDMGKTIEHLYAKVVQAYIEEVEQEADKIQLAKCGIPDADMERINELVVTIFMCCDIIESCIIDTNSIIHRTDKELSFAMFNGFSQLAQMVKDKLKFLQQNSGYGKQLVWADKCDNMYEMMQSKARSIIRKRKEASYSGAAAVPPRTGH